MTEERLIKVCASFAIQFLPRPHVACKSANYVRTELPVRIAHRLRDLQALPYVVVTQEGIAKVYEVSSALCIEKECSPDATSSSIGQLLTSGTRYLLVG